MKRDCPTCELIEGVLADIADRANITVYSQDDPNFPSGLNNLVDDKDLFFSWHHEIETVPTLLNFASDGETSRVVGWDRAIWEEFTGLKNLGTDIAPFRPGCGSLSVDPNLASYLDAKFSGSSLIGRRIEFAELEDSHEAMFDRGLSLIHI